MGRPLTIVVLVDALSWEVIQNAPGGPWLDDLLPERRPLTTVLGFSSGAIPSLLSGSWPDENGRWLMYSRAGRDSPLSPARWFAMLPPRLQRSYKVSRVLHRVVERRVKGYFALYDIPWCLLPQFDLAERENLYEPGGMNGHRTWFDRWHERGLRVRTWDWRTPEEDNADAFESACAETGSGAADVLFWYTPGQDALQHRVGTRAPAVFEHLEWLGSRIRDGARRAKIAGRPARIYVFSDHGMTDVTRHYDLMREVEEAAGPVNGGPDWRKGSDWLPFYDSTMARFWWPSSRARDRLRPRILERLSATGAGVWLDEGEQRKLGVRFADQRYGEDIFLLHPGGLIVPSFMGAEAVCGMHGYHPSEPTSSAIAVSNRPFPDGVRHVVDVAGFIQSESESKVGSPCPASAS